MPARQLTRKTLEEPISAIYEISSANDEAEHPFRAKNEVCTLEKKPVRLLSRTTLGEPITATYGGSSGNDDAETYV